MFMILHHGEGELMDETGRSVKRFPTKGSAKAYRDWYAKQKGYITAEFEIRPIPKGDGKGATW